MKLVTDKAKYSKHRTEIIEEIKDYYESALELCGENDAMTIDAKQLYDKVITYSLEECQEDIEKYFQFLYEIVGGEIGLYNQRTVQLFESLA